MSYNVTIVEVGPRDGLQNEKKKLNLKTKIDLIQKLADAGLNRIEVGAFVSPKWVPQMADSNKVVQEAKRLAKKSKSLKNAQLSVLVPNTTGLDLAIEAGVDQEIAIFAAASETFSRKNMNCSISESVARYEKVFAQLSKTNSKLKVRAYLSTCFYCPFEGRINPVKTIELAQKFLAMGAYEVSIGDTIGAATPGDVRLLLKDLIPAVGRSSKIAMHFHDTRGTALANILASLDAGITTFDSSIGGLGGCPYAPGAAGNVATEDVVYLLNGLNISHGYDLDNLIEINRWLEKIMKRKLPSKVGAVGPLVPLQKKGLIKSRARSKSSRG